MSERIVAVLSLVHSDADAVLLAIIILGVLLLCAAAIATVVTVVRWMRKT